MADTREGSHDKGLIERGLGAFADVRKGEAGTALMLALGIFFLLAAYYTLKPIRDSLITGVPDGAKIKSWMGAGIAILLLGAVPAYGRFASRVPRNRLLLVVGAFFVANLVAFWLLSFLPIVHTGFGQLIFACGFFLWVGIFNMMIVAQFWAFANDLYSDDQGKRLFPMIAIGQSVGSAVGSSVVSGFAKQLGTSAMFIIGAALLTASTALTLFVSSREADSLAKAKHKSGDDKDDKKDAPPAEDMGGDGDGKQGPFALVFRHRYLLLIALFSLIFTFVNTNGEYVKDTLIPELANKTGAAQGLSKEAIDDLRSAMFGSFYTWVNVIGVILQSFLVSRIVKYIGLRRAFFILPFISLLDATTIALIPLWSFVRVGKIAENATDYSLNNTLRNMLWLPTTRRMKYLAKQAVDTFFVRAGDVSSAVCVLIFAQLLGMNVRVFGFINIVLVVIWIFLAVAIVRENAKMSADKPDKPGT